MKYNCLLQTVSAKTVKKDGLLIRMVEKLEMHRESENGYQAIQGDP